jgi:hypothetical protein
MKKPVFKMVKVHVYDVYVENNLMVWEKTYENTKFYKENKEGRSVLQGVHKRSEGSVTQSKD